MAEVRLFPAPAHALIRHPRACPEDPKPMRRKTLAWILATGARMTGWGKGVHFCRDKWPRRRAYSAGTTMAAALTATGFLGFTRRIRVSIIATTASQTISCRPSGRSV